jgi:phosphoserine phosphatase
LQPKAGKQVECPPALLVIFYSFLIIQILLVLPLRMRLAARPDLLRSCGLREIVQINITGEDRPGLTAAITRVLAQDGVSILDIGQAVIHNTLSFGILVDIAQAEQTAGVLDQVLLRAQQLDQQVRFTRVSAADYQRWVDGQGQSRHIVTLLTRRVTAEQVQRVSAITAKYALNIEHIERLSGRLPLDLPAERSKGCIEFSVRGEPADPQALRAEFLRVAQELNVDIAFQQDSPLRCNRRLAVFDMDSTLIEAEVIDELAKAAGVGEQVSAITERAMRGELDFAASFRERLALLKGLPESVLAEVGASLRLTEGAEKLFVELQRLGYKTAILSGGFSYFAKQLQVKLGIDYVYANELQIVAGRLTGVAIEPIVDAQRKADLLRELAQKEGLGLEQTIAVGDGANDLPMLAIAGLGVAFRAKPLVKQAAQQAISTLGLDGLLYLLGYHDRHGLEDLEG